MAPGASYPMLFVKQKPPIPPVFLFYSFYNGAVSFPGLRYPFVVAFSSLSV
jgi:hypothetical protein